ncbi:uncharacterized protein LOC127379198 isoform X11 [Scomber scombrus]|uniref:Uncharacterized protein LOC127379198 isoform X11 n=1 Tax=Scomber scombrus TaxID=13677 RepID=A0AAV1PCD7_SCOSC
MLWWSNITELTAVPMNNAYRYMNNRDLIIHSPHSSYTSTAMAAAGVQTTKGLYFTFTLLCLVCLASSLMPKDELEKLILQMKQIQQQQDSVKADYESMGTYLRHIDGYLKIMEQLEVWVKKSDLPDNFPSMDGILQNIKDLEKLKTYLGRENEELGAKIEKTDEKFRKTMKLIKFLEENQAEL